MTVVERVGLYSISFAVVTILVGLVGFYYTQLTSDRVNIATTTFTAISIQFLVYDRLRSSALSKLDFLNKKALSPALKVAKGGIIGAHEGEAIILQQSCEILTHSGTFLRVKLYPKNLIPTLEAAKNSMFAYDKPYQKILAIGYKNFGQAHFNIHALLVVLGVLGKGDYQEPTLKAASEDLDSLKKTDRALVEEFSRKGGKAASDMGQVKKKIEEFYLENQLEEVVERDYFQPP